MKRNQILLFLVICTLLLNFTYKCYTNKEGFAVCSLTYRGGEKYESKKKKSKTDKLLENFESTCSCGKK